MPILDRKCPHCGSTKLKLIPETTESGQGAFLEHFKCEVCWKTSSGDLLDAQAIQYDPEKLKNATFNNRPSGWIPLTNLFPDGMYLPPVIDDFVPIGPDVCCGEVALLEREFSRPNPRTPTGLPALIERRRFCPRCHRRFYETRPDIKGIHCCDPDLHPSLELRAVPEMVGYAVLGYRVAKVTRHRAVTKLDSPWGPGRVIFYSYGMSVTGGCYDLTVEQGVPFTTEEAALEFIVQKRELDGHS